MLVWSPCRGACTGGTLAYVSCSHSCASIGQGYAVRWRLLRGGSQVSSGTCDCGQAVAGLCGVEAPAGAGPGVYLVEAELVDTGTGETLESGRLLVVYDPSAIGYDAPGPGGLHVLDTGFGAPLSVLTPGGRVYLPASLPAFWASATGGLTIASASGGRLRVVSAEAAVLRITIRFSDERALFSWLASMAGQAVVDALGWLAVDCPDIVGDDLAWGLLESYALAELLQSGVNVAGFRVDRASATAVIDVVARGGSFLGLDLGRVLKFATGGCIMGAVVALVGGPVTVAAALTGCLVGALVGAAVDMVAQAAGGAVEDVKDFFKVVTGGQPDWVTAAVSETTAAVDNTLSRTISDLDAAYRQGRISGDAYKRIRSDLEQLSSAWSSHKEAVTQLAAGVRTMALVGLTVGAVGGFVAGSLLAGRR